jgi:hypothetical protein
MGVTSLALFLFFAAQPPTSIHGTWTIELRDARAFLQVRTAPTDRAGDHDSSMGQSLSTDELSGLPASDPLFTASALTFELRREAGTLHFDGAFRDGRGAGLFEFTDRPEFTAEMKAIGYGDALSTWDRFVLAVHDVGPRYIRALKTEGYDRLTLDEIRRGRNHGVTLEYIRDLKSAGYKIPLWDDLVHARDHGVTLAYITDLKEAGFSGLPLDQLRRAKDHGVSREYIEDMKALKIEGLTLDQLVRLKDHGVTPGFVDFARRRGYHDNTADELIQLKNRGLLARAR